MMSGGHIYGLYVFMENGQRRLKLRRMLPPQALGNQRATRTTAPVKSQSARRLNANNTTMLRLFILVLLSAAALAAPIEKTRSCGALRSMARMYMACGGYKKAEPFLKSALSLAKSADAPDSEMCACMLDLAYLYKNQGKLTEAEAMCRSGLELQEKLYGKNHPHIAQTLRILSDICQGQVRYREAASCLERGIAIMRRVSGKNDPDVAPFKVDMARLLVTQGDFVRAEAYFSEAIVVIENSYGPEHLYTAKVLASMAKLYALQGRHARAEELTSRALPIQERIYGANHYFLAPTWLAMSLTRQSKGDLSGARALLEKSLAAVAKQTDFGHLAEADVLSRLGEFHILNKEYVEAERILRRALKILEGSHGANGDRAAIVINSLAKIDMNRGKYAEARELCHMALKDTRERFRRASPEGGRCAGDTGGVTPHDRKRDRSGTAG